MEWTFQRLPRFALLLLLIICCSSMYLVANSGLSAQQPGMWIKPMDKPENRDFTDWVKFKPDMDDPAWVDFVRKNYVVQPSSKPYNLSANVAKDPSAGQVKAVLGFLPPSGYFLECGAADGEFLSNTLYLEKELGWTGLLIEAEPTYYEKLVSRNRKAWLTPVCLALTRYPVMGEFYRNPTEPYMNSLTLKQRMSISSKMPCIPLYTLLLAVNRTVIDFFSLDVELSELEILQTIPFDKVIFKVITIESGFGLNKRKQSIKDFMVSKGYVFYRDLNIPYAPDIVFTYGGGNSDNTG